MIEVEHLSKTYGSTAAIADVSFSVESGEILGFLGPNGAGKTTTMRILSGYLPASSGTARIAGLDVHENSMGVRQRIGYLPENPPLYPEMSVEGFLFFVARIKQVPAGDLARRVTSAIERCGLVEKRKVLIRKLSKGFKQRVGIAQAIVHDPPVIILDEPTVGLDPRQIIEVRNLIKSLGGQHTIILSTHILPEVSMTCNRVTIINRGKIVAAGTPEHLMGELAAGEGYDLEVEGEADLLDSLLLPAVENLPGVRSIELIPNQQFLANRYRLRALCEPTIEPGREIAAAIIASGFGLCEMRRNRATLEDVFLRLTAAENKPEETLVHSEPEVDRNLQETIEIQDSIADADQLESPLIVDDSPVSDREESPYDSHQAESEPVSEIRESIELPEPEPIAEIVESIELPESEPEPVAEIVESIEYSEPESEPVAEIVKSIELPESEPVAETPETISDLEPELQSVADFLEIVEIQESIELPQPETAFIETPESSGSSPSEPPPVPDFLQIAKRQESIELPDSETVVETPESIELPHSETVVETPRSIELPQPETVVETPRSIELPDSETPPVVRNRQAKKRQQPSSDPSVEQPPLTKKRQIQRKQPDSDDSTTPPTDDSASTNDQ